MVVVAGCDSRSALGADSGLGDLVSSDQRSDVDNDAPRDGQPEACQHPPVVKKCSAGWCKIPAGCFTMGSPPDEPCREAYGKKETQHQVTLTHGFEIAATETTRAEFLALMGYLPTASTDPQPPCPLAACPVGMLPWRRAVAYCNALSAQQGLDPCYACTGSGPEIKCAVAPSYAGSKIYTCPGYRLPTEAEWEYAYRAGTKTALYNGGLGQCSGWGGQDGWDPNADEIAWYKENSGMRPRPVGTKLPNAWGLYDMAGNVFEFCQDWMQKDLGPQPAVDPAGPSSPDPQEPRVVIRGGTAISDPLFLRAAAREDYHQAYSANYNVGLRCARTLLP
jgi:sulfatase modifying factor 1